MIINDLAMQMLTLPNYFEVLLVLGMMVLYVLGCGLTHKGRLFYILPIISTLIGHLFIQSVILEKEYTEDPIIRRLMETVSIIYVILMIIGAYFFGENNISLRRGNDKNTK